jgi:hypothetical protein
MGLLMVACGGSSGTTAVVDTSKMMVSFESTFIKSVQVGNPTDFNLDVKDVGTVDIPNLDLLFDDGDRFLDKYTVTSAGSCKVDKGLPGLACGKLAHGAELKFVVTAQPKSAGDFVLKFHIANNKTRLHEADDNEYEYSWSQTVTS